LQLPGSLRLKEGSAQSRCALIFAMRCIKLTEVQGSYRERYLGEIMEWTAPAFEEVCLNCEINSYASAAL
jgi:coenzyme PQQ precursor peptide PqqA